MMNKRSYKGYDESDNPSNGWRSPEDLETFDDREGKTPSSMEPEGADEYLASLPDTTDEKEGRA
jgi:hypothetical protein